MSIFDFWDMTYGEVVDTVRAYNKRKENDIKQRAIMDYKLSECIIRGISSILSKNEGFTFNDIYKGLFPEEEKIVEENKQKAKVEINKQRFKEFAQFHNSRRKEGK